MRVKSSTNTQRQENARISLQTLQPTANNESLVGRGRTSRSEKKDNEMSEKKVEAKEKIQKKKPRVKNAAVQVCFGDFDSEENELIAERPSEQYWKDLTEKRKKALIATLKENEEIMKENQALRDEIQAISAKLDEIRGVIEVLRELEEETDDIMVEEFP